MTDFIDMNSTDSGPAFVSIYMFTSADWHWSSVQQDGPGHRRNGRRRGTQRFAQSFPCGAAPERGGRSLFLHFAKDHAVARTFVLTSP